MEGGGGKPTRVEGAHVVIRHPARGEFPAVVEVQVRCPVCESPSIKPAKGLYLGFGENGSTLAAALVMRG